MRVLTEGISPSLAGEGKGRAKRRQGFLEGWCCPNRISKNEQNEASRALIVGGVEGVIQIKGEEKKGLKLRTVWVEAAGWVLGH